MTESNEGVIFTLEALRYRETPWKESVMGITDFQRLCENVRSNLTAKPCFKPENKGKNGCIGLCADCHKQQIYLGVVRRNQDDELLQVSALEISQGVEPFDTVRHKMIAGMTAEQRVNFWQGYFAEQVKQKCKIRTFRDPIDKRGQFGRTRVIQSMLDGDKQDVMDLLAEGADPDIPDNSGMTLVDIARLEGLTEFIKLFEEIGLLKKK